MVFWEKSKVAVLLDSDGKVKNFGARVSSVRLNMGKCPWARRGRCARSTYFTSCPP